MGFEKVKQSYVQLYFIYVDKIIAVYVYCIIVSCFSPGHVLPMTLICVKLVQFIFVRFHLPNCAVAIIQ